jgi:hypothetical protein
MSDFIFFEPDPYTTKPAVPSSAPTSTTKPHDIFTTPPLAPHTLFYLTIIAPHTESFLVHGPYTSFTHVLPLIESSVSNFPRAIDKLTALRRTRDVWGVSTPNPDFAERGFDTFVVDGQRGV